MSAIEATPAPAAYPVSSMTNVDNIIKQQQQNMRMMHNHSCHNFEDTSSQFNLSHQSMNISIASEPAYGSMYGSAYNSTWSSPQSCSPPLSCENAPWPMVPIPHQATACGAPQPVTHTSATGDSSSSTGQVQPGGSLPSAAELFGFRPNYYPNFDPKEYFCDTVAVENASMVAQIVGKKGAKIKHLVAKYGTRIRTPNVDQEPVFVIKGKRADVYRVKQEIMSAAAHFLRIEQGKRQKLDSVMNSTDSTSMKLFIPTRYVGLVIGRNGRIVRELQTTHQVYIETPKFDLRHFFRIYGTDFAIQCAIQAIYELLVKKSGICFTERRQDGDEVHFVE